MQNYSIVYLAHSDVESLRAVRFSLLSLFSRLNEFDTPPQVVVYTDTPGYFNDMNLVIEELDSFIVDYWKGEPQYEGLLKWRVFDDFFRTYHGNLLYVGAYKLWHEDAIEELNAGKFEDNLVLNELGALFQLTDTGFDHIQQFVNGNNGIHLNELPEIPNTTPIYDTEVIGIKAKHADTVQRVVQYIEALYSVSKEEVTHKLASSVVLDQEGPVSTIKGFIDIKDNKAVVDVILSEFFWLNFDLPLEQQLKRSMETERLLASKPAHYNTNFIKRFRDIILS